jgi:hypothetical protein
MFLERRDVLRAAGSAIAIGLAGCSIPFTSRPELDFTVENYREKTVVLLIEVVHSDGSDRSEAVMYQDRVEIPAQSVGDDEWRVTNIGPAEPYRIEVDFGSETKTYHYHYIPDCTGADAPYDPRVHLILNENPGVSFQQTTCSADIASAP